MKTPQLTLIQDGSAARTQLVEIAPGQYVAPRIAAEDVPRYGLFKLLRQTDGSIFPVLKHYAQHVRMTHDLCTRLGLEGLSKGSLYRLIQAGFVACKRPTPNVILVDLGSLVEHVEATRDPEFWTPERISRFRAADIKSR